VLLAQKELLYKIGNRLRNKELDGVIYFFTQENEKKKQKLALSMMKSG
jgi:hypothetical protein